MTDGEASHRAAELAADAVPQATQRFDWRRCWYPVAVLEDLPQGRPYRFSLYDEPFVLFEGDDGRLGCLADRCPHRGARLSDGQIVDGKIECLYHGWQFGNDGQCRHIPQLPREAPIPGQACARSFAVVERQGIVWMWLEDPTTADFETIPTIGDLEAPGTHSTDYVRDLPYDQSYYIENVIDPAHVHITHHNIIGFREFARPMEMEILDVSASGFSGWGKGMGPSSETWGKMQFLAPNIVAYSFRDASGERVGGTVLYSTPTGEDRCRVLLRNYSNAPRPWRARLTPRWWQHVSVRNAVLESDMQLIMGQKATVERMGASLKDVYLPLATCDRFVVEYRKWIDRFGASLPFHRGYSTAKASDGHGRRAGGLPLDRLSQHTRLCNACSQAYDVVRAARRLSAAAVPILLGLGLVASPTWLRLTLALLAGLAMLSAAGAHALVARLE